MTLLVAAPSSGAGKTTITLGLLRALRDRGIPVRSAKQGPDYIDPRFHEAATGAPCPNLDPWAMPQDRLSALADGAGPLIIEGAMGLYDGAGGRREGSGEDLAARLGATVLLVIDAARASRSIAAIVSGMTSFCPDLRFGGLILNNVGSDRHEAMLKAALAEAGAPPVLGAVRRNPDLAHPDRHLGLVQASERTDLDSWLALVAADIAQTCDLDAILALGSQSQTASPAPRRLPPIGQRIAVARDEAFAFAYPHLLDDWHAAGAEILPFSPLQDQAAAADADAIYLPGGYPELHAGRIAANTNFMQSLRNAAKNTEIYGECGGYMTLGEGLIDTDGMRHEMAGLLKLETSFAMRRLHLGYRRIAALGGPLTGTYTAHEFHYSTEISAKGAPLFEAVDASGDALGSYGLREGHVCGSYLHVIDRDTAPQTAALDPHARQA